MDQSNLTESVNSLFRSLENFTQNEGIIGKPVTHGDKTFLPVVSITVGYGGGNATMRKQSNSSNMNNASPNSGTDALGLGAKLCTDSVIVIDKDNVTMMPINSNTSTLMDKIPQVISSVNQMKQSGQTQAQNQMQNSQPQG